MHWRFRLLGLGCCVPRAVPHSPLLQAQRRCGVVIEVVPETDDGEIDVEALERLVNTKEPPKLIAISHVATNSGAAAASAAP